MSIHRTAMGRAVDMSSLQAKNEKVRAVGNMGVNARGDTIDSAGKVIVPVTNKVNSNYAQTVAMSSQARSTNKIQADIMSDMVISTPVMPSAVAQVEEMELTEAERAMEDEFDDDDLTEQIKKLEIAQQQKKGKK
jgi:hypothetical protein